MSIIKKEGDNLLTKETSSEEIRTASIDYLQQQIDNTKITGSYSSLTISCSGSDTDVDVDAGEIVLKNSIGQGKIFNDVSESISMAITGAGGLEDGSSESAHLQIA